jgi:uncharacterized protein
LSKCAFRPSDDATTLPYLIPANAMTAVELDRLAAVLDRLGVYADVATRARALAVQLRSAIATYGIVNHPVHGRIYAYEVDCYSSSYIMDDANVPSLLALPYLGFVSRDDEVYRRTRAVLLSANNPFYFSGTAGAGIGGPHIGLGYIWPMGLSVQVRAVKRWADRQTDRQTDRQRCMRTWFVYVHMHACTCAHALMPAGATGSDQHGRCRDYRGADDAQDDHGGHLPHARVILEG